MPKSSSFTSPARDTRMFEGFRSRWTTSAWCACCVASQTTAEETQAIVDGQPVRVGVRRDRRAVDVLHHQVRRALRGVAGIDQAGDVGMREAGEDVALGREAEGAVRARRASHQLQRDTLLVLAVVALGQVDRAHATVAEDVDHAPWAEADADERIRVGRRPLGVVDQPLDLERVLRPVGGEHRVDLGAQTAVCAAHAVEVASALTLRQLERTLERCVEARPPVRIPGQSHECYGRSREPDRKMVTLTMNGRLRVRR